MYIQQLYTNCLAEAAYYIESNGEAAIIDPLRETEPYLKIAQERKARIRYIFETHFHADFVSGHIDLARSTGAQIIYGPGAKAEYDIYVARDEEEFPLGHITLKLLHTPGHTLESSCILLLDENRHEKALFSGDTLFAGDVGRPDLAVKSDLTKEDLAGLLYESIQKKIMPLQNEVVVYPGHGAGSACGKNIGKESFSSIGEQKEKNYALRCSNKEEFVKAVSSDLTAPPKYFFMDAAINKKGYENIDTIMARNCKGLSIDAVQAELQKGAILLDTRPADVFEQGFIPGSMQIGLNGQYAIWVGSLLDAATPLILVTEPGQERESILRLARVGYEQVKGYLQGGFESWEKSGRPTDSVSSIEARELLHLPAHSLHFLDVRDEHEWKNGVMPGATMIPLQRLEAELYKLQSGQRYYIYCAGGYRSMIAASILKRYQFSDVVNIKGGMKLIQELGIELQTLAV